MFFKAFYSSQSWVAHVKFGSEIPKIHWKPARPVRKFKFYMTQKKNKLLRKSTDVFIMRFW